LSPPLFARFLDIKDGRFAEEGIDRRSLSDQRGWLSFFSQIFFFFFFVVALGCFVGGTACDTSDGCAVWCFVFCFFLKRTEKKKKKKKKKKK
jgi:hypothetical protein